MAVLGAQSVQHTTGGLLENPNLTGELWNFSWINQFMPSPYVSDTLRAGQASRSAHWPVEANGRAIEAHRMGAFVDDFYYRIHISPQRLDLGNVVSDQSTDLFVWNAWLEPRTLNSITGTDEGVLVTGQPSPPLLVAALSERLWKLTVTPLGQPTLDTVIRWNFEGGESVGIRVTANRIIGWTFAPDWADGVIERLSSATDILQSESAAEQRRALRQAPRREFEASMYVEGRERQLLDLVLRGWSARTWAVPLWHEIQLLRSVVPAGTQFVPCDTAFLDFRAGGLAMLRGESAFTSETVAVEQVLDNGLQLARATQMEWPAGTRLYPVRSAQLVEEPSLTRLTDMAISADVHFLVVEPCDWSAVMPGTLYRGHPVFESRPDESEDLTHKLSRLLLTLDNGSALPLYTDTADRALSVVGHRWIDLGREARADVRSFIYAMRGRQKAVWVPTHADDLTLAGPVTEVSTTLGVLNCGYTRFASAKPGRRDVRIELRDGTAIHRRITGSVELSQEIEQLALDSALGRQIQPADVARISWLALFRFDSDTQEIEHQTDSEGIGSWSTVFREVPDES